MLKLTKPQRLRLVQEDFFEATDCLKEYWAKVQPEGPDGPLLFLEMPWKSAKECLRFADLRTRVGFSWICLHILRNTQKSKRHVDILEATEPVCFV